METKKQIVSEGRWTGIEVQSMKRYLLLDDEGQDLEAAVRLLREHGFTVSEQAGGTAA